MYCSHEGHIAAFTHLLSQHHRSFGGGTYACPLQHISVFDGPRSLLQSLGLHRVRSSQDAAPAKDVGKWVRAFTSASGMVLSGWLGFKAMQNDVGRTAGQVRVSVLEKKCATSPQLHDSAVLV